MKRFFFLVLYVLPVFGFAQQLLDSVPAPIRQWLNAESANANSGEKRDFFTRDSVTVSGYLVNQLPENFIGSGMAVTLNSFDVFEPDVSVFEIEKDGRFQVRLLIDHPLKAYLKLGDVSIPFYAVPGQKLGLAVKLQSADRVESLQYIGPNVDINTALFPEPKLADIDISGLSTVEQLDSLSAALKTRWDTDLKTLDQDRSAPLIARKLIQDNINLYYATILLRATQTLGDLRGSSSSVRFEFLNRIDFNDPELLTNNISFMTFINLLSTMDVVSTWRTSLPNAPAAVSGAKYCAAFAQLEGLLKSKMGIPTGFITQLLKVHALRGIFLQHFDKNKDAARQFLSDFENCFSNPVLIEKAETFFYAHYSPKNQHPAYTLEASKERDMLYKYIDRFKGKYVLIDFWAIDCAPCVQTIQATKHSRDTLHDKVEYVYFTTDRAPASDLEKDFIKEQGMKNTYRITMDEMNALRKLFHFLAIPTYILVGPNGTILNDDFGSKVYTLKEELAKIELAQ